MSNLFNWPPEAREQFAELQTSIMSVVSPALEKLREQLDAGSIKTDKYKEALQALLDEFRDSPLAVKAIQGALDGLSEDITDLNELTKEWVKNFQDGMASAIVSGEGFADTLINIGKEIEKMIVKMMLFGKDGSGGLFGGWLSDLFKGWHSGGIIGADSQTFTRRIQLPKFHSGSIVGVNEELAVLKKGEGVFTAGQMEAIGRLGGIGKIEINVGVENNGGGAMSDVQANALGSSIKEVVRAEVANSLYDYARSGALRTA